MSLLEQLYDLTGLAAAEIHRDQARTFLIEATDRDEGDPAQVAVLAALAQAHTAQAQLEMQIADLEEVVTAAVLSLEAQQVVRWCLSACPAEPILAWHNSGAVWQSIEQSDVHPRGQFYFPAGPLDAAFCAGTLEPCNVARDLDCDCYSVNGHLLFAFGDEVDWQQVADALRLLLSLPEQE
jgi:hypothetical protein